MLTGYQCEVVAFIGEGEFICHDCAHKQLDEVGFSASERGCGELSPVIRYSLDEYNGERTWEYAEEHVRDFLAGHPAIDGKDIEWRLTDRWAERHPYEEHCGNCGEAIS